MDAVRVIKRIGIMFKLGNKINDSEETEINEYIGIKLLNSIKYQYHFGIVVIFYLLFNTLVYNKRLLFKKTTWWNLKEATLHCIN